MPIKTRLLLQKDSGSLKADQLVNLDPKVNGTDLRTALTGGIQTGKDILKQVPSSGDVSTSIVPL